MSVAANWSLVAHGPKPNSILIFSPANKLRLMDSGLEMEATKGAAGAQRKRIWAKCAQFDRSAKIDQTLPFVFIILLGLEKPNKKLSHDDSIVERSQKDI